LHFLNVKSIFDISPTVEGLIMGLFDKVKSSLGSGDMTAGAINNGPQKKTGGHDHRSNTGDDRTQAQKKADKEKRK